MAEVIYAAPVPGPRHDCRDEIKAIPQELAVGSIVACSCGKQWIRKDWQRAGSSWHPYSPPGHGAGMVGPDVAHVPGTNSGHGHVWKRPDGMVARCGGPRMCAECQRDKALVDSQQAGGGGCGCVDTAA